MQLSIKEDPFRPIVCDTYIRNQDGDIERGARIVAHAMMVHAGTAGFRREFTAFTMTCIDKGFRGQTFWRLFSDVADRDLGRCADVVLGVNTGCKAGKAVHAAIECANLDGFHRFYQHLAACRQDVAAMIDDYDRATPRPQTDYRALLLSRALN